MAQAPSKCNIISPRMDSWFYLLYRENNTHHRLHHPMCVCVCSHILWEHLYSTCPRHTSYSPWRAAAQQQPIKNYLRWIEIYETWWSIISGQRLRQHIFDRPPLVLSSIPYLSFRRVSSCSCRVKNNNNNSLNDQDYGLFGNCETIVV